MAPLRGAGGFRIDSAVGPPFNCTKLQAPESSRFMFSEFPVQGVLPGGSFSLIGASSWALPNFRVLCFCWSGLAGSSRSCDVFGLCLATQNSRVPCVRRRAPPELLSAERGTSKFSVSSDGFRTVLLASEIAISSLHDEVLVIGATPFRCRTILRGSRALVFESERRFCRSTMVQILYCARALQHSSCALQHSVCGFQFRACGIQNSACRLQNSACGRQHSACESQNVFFLLPNSANVWGFPNNACRISNKGFGLRNKAAGFRHRAFVARLVCGIINKHGQT